MVVRWEQLEGIRLKGSFVVEDNLVVVVVVEDTVVEGNFV